MITICPVCSRKLYIHNKYYNCLTSTCGLDEFNCHLEFSRNKILINNKINLFFQSYIYTHNAKQAIYTINYNNIDIYKMVTSYTFHNKIYEMLENDDFNFLKLKSSINNFYSNLIFI